MALKVKPSRPVSSWGSANSGPCLSPVSFLLYHKAGTTQASSTFPEETKLIPAFHSAFIVAVFSPYPLTSVLYMVYTFLSFRLQLQYHLPRKVCHDHPSKIAIQSISGHHYVSYVIWSSWLIYFLICSLFPTILENTSAHLNKNPRYVICLVL